MQKVTYSDINIKIASESYNVRDDLKHMDVVDIQQLQNNITIPVEVCTLNVTGNLNIGMIMRTAVIFGYKHMYVFGRRAYDRRSTVGAQNYMPLTFIDGMIDDMNIDEEGFIDFLYDYKLFPIFVETGGFDFSNFGLSHKHSMNLKGLTPCVIFGNEGMGIPENIINHLQKDNRCYVLSIPQFGVMRSLNVGVAAGIVLEHISRIYAVNRKNYDAE